MKAFDCIVTHAFGLHARPAGLLVKEASRFSSSVTVFCGDKQADGKKIFSLMGLGAKQSDLVRIVVEGEDEALAASVLEQMVNEHF